MFTEHIDVLGTVLCSPVMSDVFLEWKGGMEETWFPGLFLKEEEG